MLSANGCVWDQFTEKRELSCQLCTDSTEGCPHGNLWYHQWLKVGIMPNFCFHWEWLVSNFPQRKVESFHGDYNNQLCYHMDTVKFKNLWANEISRDLGLRRVSGGYPILHSQSPVGPRHYESFILGVPSSPLSVDLDSIWTIELASYISSTDLTAHKAHIPQNRRSKHP